MPDEYKAIQSGLLGGLIQPKLKGLLSTLASTSKKVPYSLYSALLLVHYYIVHYPMVKSITLYREYGANWDAVFSFDFES
jgi:hypothetical protein